LGKQVVVQVFTPSTMGVWYSISLDPDLDVGLADLLFQKKQTGEYQEGFPYAMLKIVIWLPSSL
jgi:hypothetical protein